MSLWFYGYFNPSYLVIICGSIAVNYGLYRLMEKFGRRKIYLFLGIIFNVSLLFYFKYFNFFVENINFFFKTNFVFEKVLLPLGISFFTFQQISFIIDAYKGEAKDYSFIEYALFVAFFPQLVAGPIVLHSELIPQFRDKSNKSFDYTNVSIGITMFTVGLSKKILLADTFGKAVDWGIQKAAEVPVHEGALTISEIIIVMLSYSFQIYFDFSGYSDMATGLGKMFNLTIPRNFNSPYKAMSVYDFWKRWHITLSRFLTTYIYIPLGGSRKGTLRAYINTFVVFLVSGFWHGANWTYIMWGLVHGVAQCVNKLTGKAYKAFCDSVERSFLGKAGITVVRVIQWILNFIFINFTMLLFRSESVTMFIQILRRLTVLNLDVRSDLIEPFRIPKLYYALRPFGIEVSDNNVLMISMLAYMIVTLIICLCFKNNYERKYKLNALSLVSVWGLLMLCIVSLSSVSAFLYFNF
ncbi:MBOAT family O-acyltransferase [Butyrivibrio sp. WCD3002]|uniref:MBOAT family O-acyltransferase n=1 Tax=Butyrivibrio sp. WCD3002 TaxID=1280676 RepID=UPI001FA73E82|nr:MBOAT family O-acyltransferase [Butyrivibrio sp. WCD3002]